MSRFWVVLLVAAVVGGTVSFVLASLGAQTWTVYAVCALIGVALGWWSLRR